MYYWGDVLFLSIHSRIVNRDLRINSKYIK
jgi:hypothetical protein